MPVALALQPYSAVDATVSPWATNSFGVNAVVSTLSLVAWKKRHVLYHVGDGFVIGS